MVNFAGGGWKHSRTIYGKLAGVDEEVLLGLDGLKAQNNQPFWDQAALNGIVLFYTPPDCTDVLAPCDHHVFVQLKNLIKISYQRMSEEFRRVWSEENDELCAGNKRRMIAQWVSDAWSTMCDGSTSQAFFKSAFTSTGYLMKLDDPCDEIKIKGLPVYNFVRELNL